MYKKILVPLDGSKAAECVLPHVSSLACGTPAEVLLVRTLEHPYYDYLLRDAELSVCLDDEHTKEAEEYLGRIAKPLAEGGLSVSTCVLAEHGAAADVIVGFARSSGADLIAISAHGGSAGMRRILGSVADRIVHSSRIPVLLVHPP